MDKYNWKNGFLILWIKISLILLILIAYNTFENYKDYQDKEYLSEVNYGKTLIECKDLPSNESVNNFQQLLLKCGDWPYKEYSTCRIDLAVSRRNMLRGLDSNIIDKCISTKLAEKSNSNMYKSLAAEKLYIIIIILGFLIIYIAKPSMSIMNKTIRWFLSGFRGE
ncbi:MAG: hypothetical protein VX154_04610 [Pseudomonadota bacterium]|nr:hypothetical protein [Pseudomonadota bacterium]